MFNCNICGNSELNEVFTAREMMFGTGKLYKYNKCLSCGAMQIDKPVTNINELYPDSYSGFADYKNNIVLSIKKILLQKIIASEIGHRSLTGDLLKNYAKNHLAARSLKGLIEPGMKILDVGCGKGELIEALYNIGFKNVSGVEPFAANENHSNKFPIYKLFLFDLDENKKYDLIMLHHSFEHMESPAAIMQKISKLLAVNGTCMIRIPVCDSAAFEQYKENWVQWDAPRHVFLHTDKSMHLLCEQAGLRVTEVKDDSYSFQFIGSEQFKKDIGLNSPKSYYRPFYKKLLPGKQHLFSASEVKAYERKAEELNKEHKGDQRMYIIKAKAN